MSPGEDRFTSILRFSPFSLPDARRYYMVLTAFCDGSKSPGLVTLAGIAAPEGTWPLFESMWADVLERHDLECWHTTDAMSPTDPKRTFVKPASRKNWNLQRSLDAKDELSALILNFLTQARDNRFQVSSCTVNLEDYKAVRGRNKLLRSPAAICVDFVCGGVTFHNPDPEIVIYFDVNETFLREIQSVWKKDRKKENPRIAWARRVKTVAPLDSTALPIQAADLVAWDDRNTCRQSHLLAAAKSITFGKRFIYYDAKKIESQYPPEKEEARARGIKRAKRKTRETQLLADERRD